MDAFREKAFPAKMCACIQIQYLNELITHELTLETQQHQHNYYSRNKVNLRLPCVKRKWGKQRTAYHAVNDFNSLSEMIRDCANVNIFKRQAPVVQRLDNAIHRINHYPAESAVCFVNTYLLDSDLHVSSG